MHSYYTEPDFDYALIDDIASKIGEGLVKWGRVAVRQCKEKYGTVRVYVGFGVRDLTQLIWPRYMYRPSNCPKWLWDIQYTKANDVIFGLINKIVVPYHIWLYRRMYRLAVKQHPEYKVEILVMADYSEYLKGLGIKFEDHWETL